MLHTTDRSALEPVMLANHAGKSASSHNPTCRPIFLTFLTESGKPNVTESVHLVEDVCILEQIVTTATVKVGASASKLLPNSLLIDVINI